MFFLCVFLYSFILKNNKMLLASESYTNIKYMCLHLSANQFISTFIRIFFFIGTAFHYNNEKSNLKSGEIFSHDISRMILENVFQRNLTFNEINGFIWNQKATRISKFTMMKRIY